tara:strand:+ start:78 stop:695 length:618 start_codon:yes stop_codon:yes gene_type:complete
MAERTLAQMIAPVATEEDATMVDVYGLKSQAADNMAGAHTVLAGLGMVPVVGNIADAVDTMLYLAEGDVGGAGLSALSALPFAGLFAGGLKTVKSGAKAIKGGKKTLTTAEKLEDLEKSVRKTGTEMSEKMPRTSTYDFPEESWSPTGKTRSYNVPYQTKSDKLLQDLTESDLDMVDFQNKLSELERIDPEKAMMIAKEFGYGGF